MSRNITLGYSYNDNDETSEPSSAVSQVYIASWTFLSHSDDTANIVWTPTGHMDVTGAIHRLYSCNALNKMSHQFWYL